jgi:hypothetical protein
MTDGWIDRKETVGVVGWWRLSLSCPRPSIYLGNPGENFSTREKRLKRGQKQYLRVLSKDPLVELSNKSAKILTL